MKHIQRGFTLIELAIALAIVTLLLGGLSVPLSKRITEQQYTQTQISIDTAIEALVGFALLNQRLPCPDISTAMTDNRDGIEDALTGAPTTCVIGASTSAFDFTLSSDGNGASWGDLPWKTLGLSPPYHSDAWNNRLRYAVVTHFVMPTSTAPLKTNLSSSAASDTLMIYCGNPATTTAITAAPGCIGPTYLISQDVAFVVYSSGANGWGSTSVGSLETRSPFTTTQLTFAPDEATNGPEKKTGTNATAVAARRQFVTRDRTESSSQSGEFDDLLGYMPRAKLAARLMNAGLYP